MSVNLKTCEYSIPKTIWGKAGGHSSFNTYWRGSNGMTYGNYNFIVLRGIPGKVLEVTGIWVEGNNVIAELSRSSMPMYWANQWSGSWGGYEHSVNNEEALPGYNTNLEAANTSEGAQYGHWWVPISKDNSNSGEGLSYSP